MVMSNPDIINSCRVCLKPNQDGDYQNLYQSPNQGKQRLLSEAGILYEYLFNVPLNDLHYYPQCLCNSCDLQMKLFKKLKDKAYKTLEFLENLYDKMDNDKEYIQQLTGGCSAPESEQDSKSKDHLAYSEVCQEDEFETQESSTNNHEGILKDGSDGYIVCDILSENQDSELEYQENIEFPVINKVHRNTSNGCEIQKLSLLRRQEETGLQQDGLRIEEEITDTNIAQEFISSTNEIPTEPKTHNLQNLKETIPELGIKVEEIIDKDDYVTEIYELIDESKMESHSDDNENNMKAMCDVEYIVEEYTDDTGSINQKTTQHTFSIKKRRLSNDLGRKPNPSTTTRQYKCISCQMEFKNSQEQKLHRTQHHDKKYPCNVCSKELKSTTALVYHMKLHTGLPSFECELCQKTFNQKAHYQYHMNRHNNVRDFKCDKCEKAFLSKADLKVHLRLHTGERPYVCNICGKNYMMMEHLKTHLLTHTGQDFQCDICNNKFSTHKTLRLHVQTIHADEPRFKCVFCLKLFRRKHHLQYHIKLHEKNLNCLESDYELDDPDAINEKEIKTEDLDEQYSIDPGFIALDY